MSKNAQEIRDLSDEELEARYLDERKELFKLANEQHQSRQQFEKPHRLKQTRKQIARLLTIKREKQLAKG